MSKRTVILRSLISHIAQTTGSTGFRGMRFLHEINTFPSFYIHPQNENRVHRGAGYQLAVMSCSIRAFQWTDTLDDVETYARQLEAAVQTFKPQYRGLVEEARVTSLRTDEGIMAPYALVDIELDILYQADTLFGIRADTTMFTVDSTKLTADGAYK